MLSDSLSNTESDDSQSTGSEVTICEFENGENLTLYHLIAGRLDDIFGCENKPLGVNSWQMKDRRLYDFIEDRCEKDLLEAQVSPEKMSKLLREGPSYVITPNRPEKWDNRSSIISIKPELSKE